jgi:hypothetical protein
MSSDLLHRDVVSSGSCGCGHNDSPEVNVLSVGDTSLNTTAPVGGRPQGLLPGDGVDAIDKRVVVGASREHGSSESRANLESFGRRDREHGVSEDSLELVKGRLSETDGAVSDHTSDCTSHRVVSRLCRSDRLRSADGQVQRWQK